MEHRQTKHRAGRPAIGKAIAVRLPPDLVSRLDQFAGSATRSDAVRQLLEAALNGGQGATVLQSQLAALGAAAAASVRRIQEAIADARQRMAAE
jgi:metal-responsive CopG/Arc/MetJ family transcriptional regulator